MKNSTMSNYELLHEIDENIRQIATIRKMLPQYHRKLKRYRKTVLKILQKNLNLVDQQLEIDKFGNVYSQLANDEEKKEEPEFEILEPEDEDEKFTTCGIELLFADIFQDSEDTLASNVEGGPPEMDEEKDKEEIKSTNPSVDYDVDYD